VLTLRALLALTSAPNPSLSSYFFHKHTGPCHGAVRFTFWGPPSSHHTRRRSRKERERTTAPGLVVVARLSVSQGVRLCMAVLERPQVRMLGTERRRKGVRSKYKLLQRHTLMHISSLAPSIPLSLQVPVLRHLHRRGGGPHSSFFLSESERDHPIPSTRRYGYPVSKRLGSML